MKMLLFFVQWQEESSTNFSLSKETFTALILSLESLCKLCEYLLNHCQFNYVLLGHVSSDNLEERFGWLRQLIRRQILLINPAAFRE